MRYNTNNNVNNNGIIFSIFILLIIYFVYHAINGDRGIIAMLQVETKLLEQKNLLETMKQQQFILQNKVDLLQPNNYDTDFVDEKARDYFGLIGNNEKVLILSKEDINNMKYKK